MGIHLTPGRYLRLENKTFLIKSMNLAKKKTFRCDTDFSPAKKNVGIIFLNNFPPTLESQTAKQGLINAQGSTILRYVILYTVHNITYKLQKVEKVH